jgi:hypothetical protein
MVVVTDSLDPPPPGFAQPIHASRATQVIAIHRSETVFFFPADIAILLSDVFDRFYSAN